MSKILYLNAATNNTTLRISGKSANFRSDGTLYSGSSSFVVTKGIGSISLSRSATWINYKCTGNNTYTISVKNNTSAASRSGEIKISLGSQTVCFKVTQQANYLSLSGKSAAYRADGTLYSGPSFFSVSKGTGDITVTSSASWLKYTKNNNNYTVKVSQNLSSSSRTGSITVKVAKLTATFTVTQQANYLSLSGKGAAYRADGTLYSGPSFFSVSKGVGDITIICSDNWLNCKSMGNNAYAVGVQENTSVNNRSGYITVKIGDSLTTKFNISQSGGIDSDNDGIVDALDPDPSVPFWKIGENSIEYVITDKCRIPYNSQIVLDKARTKEDYLKLYNERKSKYMLLNGILAESVYKTSVKTRAATINFAAYILEDPLKIQEAELCLDSYLRGNVDYLEFSGRKYVESSDNAKINLNISIRNAMIMCENALKPRHTFTFIEKDSAKGDGLTLAQTKGKPDSMNSWLTFNTVAIGKTGQCSYDGTNYEMDFYYCIQDYYDFYYENEVSGKDSIGPIFNDEMAFLVAFDNAKPFELNAIVRVRVCWKKGQNLKDAVITYPDYVPYTLNRMKY